MILYAESSAVLAWLLGERAGARVRELLAGAELVFASRATIAEAQRALVRLTETGHVAEGVAAELRAVLARAATHWTIFEVGEPVLDRVGRTFPVEPVRMLEAIHLATALAIRAAEPRVALLSLDDRLRGHAVALGFGTLPHD